MIPDFLSDRPLPQCPDMERAVLSCVLQNASECLDAALARLPDGAFLHPSHRKIATALRAMRQTMAPGHIDLITLIDALEREGQLQEIGDVDYLNQLFGMVPTTANLERYLDAVMDSHAQRSLLRACLAIAAECYESDADVGGITTRAASEITAIAEHRATSRQIANPSPTEIIAEVDQWIDDARNGRMQVVPWCLHPSLDCAALAPGTMTIIGSRPRVGKTALSISVTNAQADRGYKIGFICLEMENREIMARFICQRSGLAFRDLRDGLVNNSKQEMQAYFKARDAMEKLPIHMHCGRLLSIEQIVATAKVWKKEHAIDVLYIDYVQKIARRVNGRDDMRHKVAEVSSAVKHDIAQALHIPVVLLAQLNRSSAGLVPAMEDLKEAGALEEDADNVILIDRPDAELNPKERDYWAGGQKVDMQGKAALITAKTRNDDGGDPKILGFHGHTMTFTRATRDMSANLPASTPKSRRSDWALGSRESQRDDGIW